MTIVSLTRIVTTGALLIILAPLSLANQVDERFRFRGGGEFFDGTTSFRCWELRIDFPNQRARLKCDDYDVTFRQANDFRNGRASFRTITIDDLRRRGRDDYAVELQCDSEIRANRSNQRELHRFDCQGVFDDRGFFERRSIRANFRATEPAIPFSWD